MKSDSSSIDHHLLALLQAVRDTHDDAAHATLNELLRNDAAARAAMPRLLVDEQALIHRLRDDSIVTLLDSAPSAGLAKSPRTPRWYSWRPLTAAAAGIVFGMFCTSMVYGYVAQRAGVVKKVPLTLFDPGFEEMRQIIEDGIPDNAGQWGMDLARTASAEGDVKPLRGQGMMRLDPLPKDEDMKNRPSRVYQVLDLRSLPIHNLNGDAEVEVTASFCAAKSDLRSRYVMRVFALDEAPEQATKDFWPKVESDGVASETQRFDIEPGDEGWHTFSLKLRLPPGSNTLMLILGAAPPTDIPQPPSVHYLDEVQVSLITQQPVSSP